MPTDCTFKTPDGRFNYRVGAIILNKTKLLMAHNRSFDQYYTVGGRVKLHETSEEAVIREIYEETGVRAEIDRLGFSQENFFKIDDKPYHELSFFYYIKPFDYDLINFDRIKCDGDTEELCWVDLTDLPDSEFYPEFFKTELLTPSNTVKHFITREYSF